MHVQDIIECHRTYCERVRDGKLLHKGENRNARRLLMSRGRLTEALQEPHKYGQNSPTMNKEHSGIFVLTRVAGAHMISHEITTVLRRPRSMIGKDDVSRVQADVRVEMGGPLRLPPDMKPQDLHAPPQPWISSVR